DHVVHVKAVTRSLLVAHARQGAIEAVAEPVHCETDNGKKQHAASMGGEGIADASRDLTYKSEERQVIGIHPRGHALGYPDKNALLGSSQATSVDALRVLEVGGALLGQNRFGHRLIIACQTKVQG